MKLIKDFGVIDVGRKQPIRFGLYECPICKKHFKARTANIKSGNTKSCGCNKYKKPNPLKLTTMYSSWDHMKQRCLNPNNDNYDSYGGRGIIICQEWHSFDNFAEWALQNGWKNGLSIDRIDVNGNYEPKNCRWVTQTTQSRNTRVLQKNNTSGYKGVTKIQLKNSIKYKSEIMVDRKMVRLGRFDTALEAAKAYDAYVIINNLEHSINGVLT